MTAERYNELQNLHTHGPLEAFHVSELLAAYGDALSDNKMLQETIKELNETIQEERLQAKDDAQRASGE